MKKIKTNRLVLIPHTLSDIEAWHEERFKMEQQMGLDPYGLQLEDWVLKEIEGAFPVWIKWLKDHPGQENWYGGFEIVLAEKNIAVGGIGFAGLPDVHGNVLVGYHVDLRHRGQGIAAEALQGLCEWAFEHETVNAVQATVPDWNLNSVRVMEKCGFQVAGEKDEEGMHLIVFEKKR